AKMKDTLREFFPQSTWLQLSRAKRRLVGRILKTVLHNLCVTDYLNAGELNELGLNVVRLSDYYSPLPVVSQLQRNRDRWLKPSALVGLSWDMDEMKQLLKTLVETYFDEFKRLQAYKEVVVKHY